jgi:hypothetical protein
MPAIALGQSSAVTTARGLLAFPMATCCCPCLFRNPSVGNTEIIVQHSALSGAARGLQVHVAVDACGGLSARTEDAAFRRLVQAGVVTTSIASIAGQLAGDFSQSKGGQAIGILYETASR